MWSSSTWYPPPAGYATTHYPDEWSRKLARPTIREVIAGTYRIVYRVAPDAVQILAVVHGARRFPPVERRSSE